MNFFAVLFPAKQAISSYVGSDDKIITQRGDLFWLVNEAEGWVPATSTRYRKGADELPKNLKLFATKQAALDFMKYWKGHPWYVTPYKGKAQIIQVEPVYEQVLRAYKCKDAIGI